MAKIPEFTGEIPDSLKGIFTASDYESAKRGQRLISDLIPVLDRIEQCGPDCQEFRKVLVFWQERYDAFINIWMSDPPIG